METVLFGYSDIRRSGKPVLLAGPEISAQQQIELKHAMSQGKVDLPEGIVLVVQAELRWIHATDVKGRAKKPAASPELKGKR